MRTLVKKSGGIADVEVMRVGGKSVRDGTMKEWSAQGGSLYEQKRGIRGTRADESRFGGEKSWRVRWSRRWQNSESVYTRALSSVRKVVQHGCDTSRSGLRST